MIVLEIGRLRGHVARERADIARAQSLRAKCFKTQNGHDHDTYDDCCTHVLIEDRVTGALLCTFRMSFLRGADIATCYSAQFYDLSKLAHFTGKMLEVGRFCVDPDSAGSDILRLAWAFLASCVDTENVEMLFGCSSFAGKNPQDYLDVFDLLRSHHKAPGEWCPGVKAADIFAFSALSGTSPDHKSALRRMPPLLRTYLVMGGWVSDHAVIDHHMNRLHVFTGVQVSAIPAARKRSLRSLI